MAESPDKLTDAELIEGVLAGRTAWFRPLMERHQQAVFGYLYRFLLNDTEAAQDLTQNTFLKAYQALASVDRARPFQPWLYRIAHNEAVNHLRSRSRRPETGLEEEAWAQMADPGGNSPESEHAAGEEQRAMQKALAQLKPKHREAVQLFFFEERSYEEIAQIMNVTVGTVGTLIHRGKARLRQLLGAPDE